MSHPIVASIVTTINDLFKLEIMQRVDTGNKARDTGIISLLLILMTYIINRVVDGSLMQIYRRFRMLTIRELTSETSEIINQYYKDINVKYFIQVNDKKIADYCVLKFMRNKETSTTLVIVDGKLAETSKQLACLADYDNILVNAGYELLRKYDESDARSYYNNNNPLKYVIFTDNGNHVFIAYAKYKITNIMLLATSEHVLRKFLELDNINKLDDTPVRSLKVYAGYESSALNPKKNMNMYVSKHKKKILTMLDSFINKTDTLCGYGSDNLGIMLYGEPGTGKTLLMKCIANYLNRSISIIDMREIKTRQQFANLFIENVDISRNYKKVIYVLDEFDCIKGVVRNRSKITNDNNLVNTLDIERQNAVKELKDRRLQILQIPNTDGNKETLLAELDKINKELADYENALTLDTMLTVLDGVVEHQERVIIAATNYIEEIDPALIRDGRFDIKIKLEKFDEEETRELLSKMYGSSKNKDTIARLANAKLISNKYTPIQIINLAAECGDLSNVLDRLEIYQTKKNL